MKITAPADVDSTPSLSARIRHWVWVSSGLWGFLGYVLSWSGIRGANPDSRRWIFFFSVALPLCATSAALLVKRNTHLGIAGLLLFLSIGTPTYFAWIFNLIPIVLIAFLVVSVRLDRRG